MRLFGKYRQLGRSGTKYYITRFSVIILRFRVVSGSRFDLAILGLLTSLRVELIPYRIRPVKHIELIENGVTADYTLPKNFFG